MHIKSIAITNFRNHRSTTLRLSPGLNILVGENAQGKTNLLEAIYLTCIGRGWRSAYDRDMILIGCSQTRVKTTVKKKFGDCSVEVILRADPALPRSCKKFIKVNDIPVSRMGELMGTTNCIFFSPDELRLIKEAPADRRRFLEIGRAHV